MTNQHKIIKCKSCDLLLESCRCISHNKQVEYNLCEDCRKGIESILFPIIRQKVREQLGDNLDELVVAWNIHADKIDNDGFLYIRLDSKYLAFPALSPTMKNVSAFIDVKKLREFILNNEN